jgi:hypothetical protein
MKSKLNIFNLNVLSINEKIHIIGGKTIGNGRDNSAKTIGNGRDNSAKTIGNGRDN